MIMLQMKASKLTSGRAQLGAPSSISHSERRLIFFRVLVIICLAVGAVVCGYGSYSQFNHYELALQKSQFSSVAKQFKVLVNEDLRSKGLALKSSASIFSMSCPYAYMWPNCSIPLNSFLNILDPIISITNMRTMVLAIMITPAEIKAFEDFAYDFYESNGYPGLGISSFGKGISALNQTTGVRYHDTLGLQHGERDFLVPILLSGNLETNLPSLMYNLYSEKTRAMNIDNIVDCFEVNGSSVDCISVTDNIFLVQDTVFRPAVLVGYPIAPLHNKTLLTGLTQSVYNWDTVFISALPNYLHALDVVLSGGTKTYTFRISDGKLDYSEEGDHHDRRLQAQGQSFVVDAFRGSYTYTIAIYPSEEFVDSYRTNNPLYAMAIAVGIIVFTSTFFFLYDIFMNRSAVEKELRTTINTKRLFVRFISHEIRTPLNTVHVGLQLLTSEMAQFMADRVDTSDVVAVAKVHDWMCVIQDIEESADTGILVLNDLINYDKISMGTLNADFELLSFWEIVRATTNQFKVSARRKGIALGVNLEIDDPTVSDHRRALLQRLVVVGDSVKLSQIIRNLVSNALKFSKQETSVEVSMNWEEEGLPNAAFPGDVGAPFNTTAPSAVERHVSTSFRNYTAVSPDLSRNESVRAGSLIVRVRDVGAGISAEDQLSLFQEGVQFRANQLQAGQGSGLGLWISKGLANLHSGELSAYSEGEGKGAEFRLELPAILRCETECVISNTARTVPSMASPHPPHVKTGEKKMLGSVTHTDSVRNVLVVDDSGPSRKVLSRLLRNAGFNCFEAVDGEDCVLKVAQFLKDGLSIHMVFMDFEMPKMNGPEASKALRDMGVTVPIIGVTGNVLPADKIYFLDHGANAVLHKPLNIGQLKAEIEKYNQLIASSTYSEGESNKVNFPADENV